MGGASGTYVGEKKCFRRSEGMIPLGKPRHRLENNIEMDLQEIFCDGLHWIDVAENRDKWRALLSRVKKHWVP